MPKEARKPVNFTDRFLNALKPTAQGARDEFLDKGQPGLAVRVTHTGSITFVHRTREPGKKNFARYKLGRYPALSLDDARAEVAARYRAISNGVAPSVEAARRKEREQRARVHVFPTVSVQYIEQVVIGFRRDNPANGWKNGKSGPHGRRPNQRQWRKVERVVKNFLNKSFADRPVAEITREEVCTYLDTHASHKATAMEHFSIIRRVLDWAIEKGCFGIAANPCMTIRVTRLFGSRQKRKHRLPDNELAALWSAACAMPYPEGPAYQLLILSGLRLSGVTNARRSEFDLNAKLWTIPAERMKGSDTKAVEHIVPLTDLMMAIVRALPVYEGNDYFLFSHSFGKTAAQIGGKSKKLMDAAMLAILKIDAFPKNWVNHDLRRNIRSGLPALGISSDVAEAVIAHTSARYNVYDYLDEKRVALTKWGGFVTTIDPDPGAQVGGNVVQLRRASAA